MRVMQCWDDGVVTDIRLANLCRNYGSKATFNINPGLHQAHTRSNGWLYQEKFLVEKLALDELKETYRDMTIAGHSMTHPPLTNCSDTELTTELHSCKKFIEEFFGQQKIGFAYPFGNNDERVRNAVKAAGYKYARTVENSDTVFPPQDAFALASTCKFDSPLFWEKFEAVKKQDGVFYFWGHSYELMDDEKLWADFEKKLAIISADSQSEWIDIIDLF